MQMKEDGFCACVKNKKAVLLRQISRKICLFFLAKLIFSHSYAN